MDTAGSPRRQDTMGGTPAQTSSERVLSQPNEPPLSEGHTSVSKEGKMDHTFELTDNVPSTPHDSPLSGGYTPGSDEGRMKLDELITLCTKLSKKVLDLEKEKDAQAIKILNLKRRVKKLERKRNSSISHLRRRKYRQETVDAATSGVSTVSTPVSTTGITISTAEPRNPPTTTTVFDNEDVTMEMAQTLIKIKEQIAKEKGVSITDVEDSFRIVRLVRSITTLQPLPTIDPKDKNAELAQRLHEEELAELERAQQERQRQEYDTNAALVKEFDEIQARIDVDHELVVRQTHEEQEKYTIEERARLLVEFFDHKKKQLAAARAEAIRNKLPIKTQVKNRMITYLKHMAIKDSEKKVDSSSKPAGGGRNKTLARKRAGEKKEQESAKKQKLEDVVEEQESAKSDDVVAADYEHEKEELRMWLTVVSNEEDTVDLKILSTKYLIVDWEYQNLGNVDMEDLHVYLVDLHRLVMKRFEDATPEGYNLLLWGDLKMTSSLVPLKSLQDGFFRGQIDKTLFVKRVKDDTLLMSSMRELTFFLGLQVKQKEDEIFISQDKYVGEILKKFGFSSIRTVSNPMKTNKALTKDEDDEDVDIHLYRYLKGRPKLGLWYPKDSPFILEAFSDSDYAGANLDRKSTIAEYIAASHCCGQVLWIQNQMLDYGYNFMLTKIYVNNESVICVINNPVYHSETKHIEIRHHFIRDSYEKKLIEMFKIHTDYDVADLLTKAFDVTRF
ncbi:hypothetical protein Tco_1235591 [Tanacetum coccineum]